MKPIVIRALYALSVALLVYVAYAHLASYMHAAEYRAQPVAVEFASGSELAARFAVEDSPGLAHAIEGGALHIRGKCERAGARVVLRGAPTRLVASRAKMRVRLRGSAPVDVMAGFERAEEPAREIFFAASIVGDHVEARLLGDDSIHGPRTTGDRLLFRAADLKMQLGDDAHEIALGLEPDVAFATGFFDGMFVHTVPAGWETGRLVRPTFAVTCRDPGEGVDVELDRIAWEPILRDALVRDIDDKFDGPIFDTIWRVSRADPELVETSIGLGHGLELSARATHLGGLAPALNLTSPRFRAEDFHAEVDIDVASMKQSSVLMGVGNPYLGTPFFRMVDVGVFEKEGRLVPFTSGYFAADGQAAFRTHEKAFGELPSARGTKVTLALDFEAATRRAHATVDGVVVLNEPIALQPYEDVMFHVGVNADGPASDSRLRFERVRFARAHPGP